MSEENTQAQANVSDNNTVTNDSTEAVEKNVPYDRFQEVVQSKQEMAGQIGKLQAQIDKMNQSNKAQQEAKLVEDGKLKEALDIVTKERDNFKAGFDEYESFKVTKRESLMSQLTTDEDKSIAEGLSDLNKLEIYVNKVTNVNAPSTSTARATSGKAGEFGGYDSAMEWVTKDPKGYEEARQQSKGDKFGNIFTPSINPFANE